MVRRLAVLLAAAMILSGCTEQRLFAVKAVAAGVPSLAPFFEEDGSLGRDETKVRSAQPHSGLQQGNTPGLYGGTRKPKVCDVDRLKDFLTDPRNRRKAREWARVVGITPDRIEGYIDDLTPVLLRHDTLVKNHDYKKGEAVAYNALLEAGIAVLVNDQGLPAVKCSCGNPLRSFDGDPEKISVKFEDGNKKWNGYEKSAVVTVKPSPQPLEQIKLVNVDNPDQGIDRPVGSTGENDRTFDATKRHEVPRVAGMTVDEAVQRLAELGIAVAYGDSLPPGDARVTGSDPGPGTPVRFGQAVALSVESDPDSGGGGTPPSPSETESTPGGGTPSETESTPGKGTPSETESTPSGGTPSETESTPGKGTPSETESKPGKGTPSETETTPGTEKPTEKETTPTVKPPSPDPPTPTVSSTSPTAQPTSAAPTSADPTSAGPTSTEPTTSETTTSEPASSEPGSSSEQASGGPAVGPA
ncbi:DUF6777 domain-containing protein [Streptomyces sp. NBC_00878]|uniref:DUF6777 domain-containing protein n=1 Tax=Streptomyces sp. NBC_00878 TaxID=2975854 RepID=UPI00224E748C|nr:DUF6777 domain-containing protein [Streptomyces sp. NBC_00878]MCX4910702.1 PASTA domain-containing protein [Streptomyces sp. NBC_00878]